MNKELQEHIERIREIADLTRGGLLFSKTERDSFKALISCAEELEAIKSKLHQREAELDAIQSASDELPKKIELSKSQNALYASRGSMSDEYDRYNQAKGFNQCLDLVKPIHQKQVLRIRELEQGIMKGEYQVVLSQSQWLGVTQDLEKLTKRAEEAEMKAAERLRLSLKTANEINRLKEELKWWHNLIRKHHNNETCPNLKTYVENLQKENARLKQKEELDVGRLMKDFIPEVYCDVIPDAKEVYAIRKVDGTLVKYKLRQDSGHKLATAIVSRFSLGNKELLGALRVSNEALVIASNQFKHVVYGRDKEFHMNGCAMCTVEKAIYEADQAISKIEKGG